MQTVYEIYFSPTGTSRIAAKQIAEAMDGTKVEIDLCTQTIQEKSLDRDALCIFSVPCYGGRIPQTAAERLARMRGAGTPAVVCVVFGNRAYEDALLELADCVEQSGFTVVAACAVAAQHNIMPEFGVGRPDAADCAACMQFGKAVAEKLAFGQLTRPQIDGNFPYKEKHSKPMPILVDANTCVHCGYCAKRCPVGAISADGSHVDETRCIQCMRCIHICPKHSRSLPQELVTGMTERLRPVCETRKENTFFI